MVDKRTVLNAGLSVPLAVDFSDLSEPEHVCGGRRGLAFVASCLPSAGYLFFGLSAKDADLIRELRSLSAANPAPLMIVTLGPDGAVAFKAGRECRASTTPIVDVKDTTGAGDAFASAFLCSHLTGQDVQKSLEAANRAAAASLEHLGAYYAPPLFLEPRNTLSNSDTREE